MKQHKAYINKTARLVMLVTAMIASVFTLEGWSSVSAARNGLAAGALTPMPSGAIQITGTNYITPPMKARILRNVFVMTDTIARFDEASLQASHDPNAMRFASASDQTGLHQNSVLKTNYPCMDAIGNTSTLIARESNAALGAEIAYLFAVLTDESHPGITTHMKRLPGNARPVSFSATITSIAGQWVPGAPTYNFAFQPGKKYAVIGMAVSSKGANTLQAARLVPKAGSEPSDLYPGCPASDTQTLLETWYSIDGSPWMIFDGLTPPDIAINANTAAAQAPFGHLIISEL